MQNTTPLSFPTLIDVTICVSALQKQNIFESLRVLVNSFPHVMFLV